MAVDSGFCMRRGGSLHYAAVRHRQEGFESQGHWVRSHTRTLAYVILTFQPAKTDVKLIQIQPLTVKVTQGLFMFHCFLISPALHQCPLRNVAPKNLGEHQFIILLHFKMNILFHAHVVEPNQWVHGHIIIYE